MPGEGPRGPRGARRRCGRIHIDVAGTNHGAAVVVKFPADGRSVLDIKEN
ncbi:hypothetical protein [[Pseudopropionibacterium] massiliense]|nr:hypothetical protein [[Pseudopropionibacterium] massiliense]